MTEQEYWEGINTFAEEVIELAYEYVSEDDDFDCEEVNSEAIEEAVYDLLHEIVGNSSWSIYYNYHLDIIKYSPNEDYLVDNLGGDVAAHCLLKGGLNSLHQSVAYWAMFEDTRERAMEILNAEG